MTSLDRVFCENKIDATIVQGDTMTVLCGALTSFYHKVPVFHVEAGLRSYDIYEPFPEEVMRQMTSRVADLHFAPTNVNREALLKENIDDNKIHVVGNTVIDALFCLSKDVVESSEKFYKEKKIPTNDKLVLITAHRRENHGQRIDRIIDAISYLAEKYSDHTFVIPVHPNPNVKDKIHARLGGFNNIYLLSPLDYPNLVYLMKHAKLILTDSGGIQGRKHRPSPVRQWLCGMKQNAKRELKQEFQNLSELIMTKSSVKVKKFFPARKQKPA